MENKLAKGTRTENDVGLHWRVPTCASVKCRAQNAEDRYTCLSTQHTRTYLQGAEGGQQIENKPNEKERLKKKKGRELFLSLSHFRIFFSSHFPSSTCVTPPTFFFSFLLTVCYFIRFSKTIFFSFFFLSLFFFFSSRLWNFLFLCLNFKTLTL